MYKHWNFGNSKHEINVALSLSCCRRPHREATIAKVVWACRARSFLYSHTHINTSRKSCCYDIVADGYGNSMYFYNILTPFLPRLAILATVVRMAA